MERLADLVELLADGAIHSGAALARAAGVSRTAIWQWSECLRALGLGVEAVRGRGYRLVQPLDLLAAGRIRSRLYRPLRRQLRHLELLFTTDSTNQRLLERAAANDCHGHACLAEYQTSGRGRRGRLWLAPFGSGVCLSLGWRFDRPAEALAGLSLAVGVAVKRALDRNGAAGLKLKWPNDILWEGRKLGGILIEMRGEMTGPCFVVIGVGVNVAVPAAVLKMIDRPATDLKTVLGLQPSRNEVAAELLSQLLIMLPEFEQRGLRGVLEEWRQADCIRGRIIDLASPGGHITGQALDVDEEGALLVRCGRTLRRCHAGEISLHVAS